MDTFLTGRRAAQAGFIEPSLPHNRRVGPPRCHHPLPGRARDLRAPSRPSQLLLVDSGARLLKFENMSEKAAALLCQRPTGLKGDYLRLEGFYRSASELA